MPRQDGIQSDERGRLSLTHYRNIMIASGGNADWNSTLILDLMIERPLRRNQLPRVTVDLNYHLVMMTITRGIQADKRRRAEALENRNAGNAITDPNVARSAPKPQSSE